MTLKPQSRIMYQISNFVYYTVKYVVNYNSAYSTGIRKYIARITMIFRG